MRILYLDCRMGASGDMLTSALLALCSDRDKAVEEMNSFGLEGIQYKIKTAESAGMRGVQTDVVIHGFVEDDRVKFDTDLSHSTDIRSIQNIIIGLKLPDVVKHNAIEIYQKLADAESEVHGIPVDKIHFHEVGNLDAVADVVGVAYLIWRLKVDVIYVSDINTGSGWVKCHHGTLPVPAPATSILLSKMHIFSDETNSELCTPTGAALLSYYSNGWKSGIPEMQLLAVGCGIGHKLFNKPNCLRAFLGTSNEPDDFQSVYSIKCNLDDITAEELSYAVQLLFDEGALDVYTSSAYMKKNRLGTQLECLCCLEDFGKMSDIIMKNTSTIGIRFHEVNRFVLKRKVLSQDTSYGTVTVKFVKGHGIKRFKIEFDDIKRIARLNSLSFEDTRSMLEKEISWPEF